MKTASVALAAAVLGGVALVATSRVSAATVSDDAEPTPDDSTDGPQFTVQASDGTKYVVQFQKAFETEAGHQTFWDLFDASGNRLVRYAQLDDDKSSRTFIVSPLSMTSPILDKAMRDFGIQFIGGAITDSLPNVVLASDVKTLPGQLLVLPGEYLATAVVNFPKSVVVNASLISAALKEQGFRQVAVFTSAPKGWPISTDGDYFVQCVWDGAPKVFQLPPEVTDLRSRALA